jgi:hypothetical protein
MNFLYGNNSITNIIIRMQKIKFIDGERYLMCASHLDYSHENDFHTHRANITGKQYRCITCERKNIPSQSEYGIKKQNKELKETMVFLEKLGYDINSEIPIHEQFKQRHYNEHN